jgi:sugar phosphate isomerase/epimerase
MRYAIFTVSLPDYTPEDAVRVMREHGYDGVEWRVTDQTASADGKPGFWAGNRCTWPFSTFVDDAPRIRALAEQAGLAMPTVGTYVSCENLPAVEKAMQGAVKLGAPALRVGVPRFDGKSSYVVLRDRAVSQYHDVAALAKQYGVRALIEIHMGNIVPSASATAAFVSHFDPRWVGAIHDAGNMVYEGCEHFRLGLEVLGPYLAHVHLKNSQWQAAGTRPDGSTEWRPTFAPISKGIVDFAALIRALRQVSYDGWLSFEDFSTEQPLAERVRGNLAYIKQVVQRVAEEK